MRRRCLSTHDSRKLWDSVSRPQLVNWLACSTLKIASSMVSQKSSNLNCMYHVRCLCFAPPIGSSMLVKVCSFFVYVGLDQMVVGQGLELELLYYQQ